MPHYRSREAAALLGVSDDTVRRWIDSGTLSASLDQSGRIVVDGAELVGILETGGHPTVPGDGNTSARNRLVGLVTDVRIDGVMAQIQLQCGPFRLTSLMSADSARALQFERGSIATAVVKATNIIVEKGGSS